MALVWVALLAPAADAHHSYAMYDGSVYKVFTGVIVRIIPNAAHFEMHFVPLNEQRDALVRDDKGQPLVWVAQMESAAQALKDGVTRESFPRAPCSAWGSIRAATASRPAIAACPVCSSARRAPSRNRASTATRWRATRPSAPARFRKRAPVSRES